MGKPNDKRNTGMLRRRVPKIVLAAVCAIAFAAFALAAFLQPPQSQNSGASRSPVQIVHDIEQQANNDQPASPSVSPALYVTPQPVEDVPAIEGDYNQNVVLVELAHGWSAEELNIALHQASCVSDFTVTEPDVEAGFASLPLAAGYDVSHAVAELEQLPAVSAAQPDFIYYLADDEWNNIPVDDESLSNNLEAQAKSINDTYQSSLWALSSVNAYDAWDIARAGSAGAGRVSVAVLDNGCLVTHEDLSDNIVASYNAVSSSSSYGTSDVTPNFGGHGTHVCGIISSIANNGKGTAGVSYNAGLVPIQVFEQSSNGSTASTASLRNAYNYIMNYASTYNIRVVNMSLGGATKSNASLDRNDRLLINAVDSAYNKGILTVCSAGNDAGPDEQNGAYYNFPSDWLDNAIGVIALEQDGSGVKRASYSNYNVSGQTTKDISAPGSNITSTWYSSTSSYTSSSGTSMASPYVAGIAALVFSVDPDLSAEDASAILCNTAADLGAEGWDEEYAAGEVDAFAAVKEAQQAHIVGKSEMLKGDTLTLSASKGTGWTWSSSNTSVATVSSSGVVTGKSGGTTTITISNGAVTATKQITVYDISFTGPSEVNAGATINLTFNENPDTGLWYIDVADTKIAQLVDVGDTIKIQGVSAGTTQVTATSAATPDLVVTYPITVIDLDGANAILKDATTTLTPSVSDTWTWSSSDTSVATVSSSGVVTGVGAGSATITAKSATRSLSRSITVYDASIEGDDEIRAGESITLYFSATPSSGSWTFSSSNAGYLSVKDNEDGTITATGLSAGSADVIATLEDGDDVSVAFTVTVLDSDAQYTLRDNRVSAAWANDYSPSYSYGFLSVPNSYYYYSGEAKEPDLIVYYASGTGSRATKKELEKGKDYLLTYKNNVNAGTATIYITGIGDYKDTVSTNFTIRQYPLKGYTYTSFFYSTEVVPAVSISGIQNAEYTGRAQTPQPTFTIGDGAYTLKEGTDYELSYSNNVNAGTATVKVTGKGNFSGSGTINFTITKADFSQAQISLDGWTYDGTAHSPQPAVVFGGRTWNTDEYLVSYSGNKNAGICTATITPNDTSNYSGTATGSCTVAKAQISAASIAAVGSQTYTGSAIEPSPAVTFNGKTLSKGSDYTLSYRNNVNVGTATIVVEGKGNFTGTKSTTFAIISAPSSTSAPEQNKTQDSSNNNQQANESQQANQGAQETPKAQENTEAQETPKAQENTETQESPKAQDNLETHESPSGTISMYRLYNANSGEHFYTADASERANLINVGWNDEGFAWTAPETSNTPVYRMYNPVAGEHHFTTGIDERNLLVEAGWNYEGVGWYSDDAQTVPLYRDYNPNAFANNHNYTTSIDEHNMLISVGWREEGVAWYGV